MIEAGDRVLLIGNSRAYYVTAGEGMLSTDLGMIPLSDLVGREAGDQVQTHLGTGFSVRIPRPTDFFVHAKRSGAPMHPKDIGSVIAYTGMNKKDHVLDAGTGSGIAAIFFGSIAESVTTYEQRPEFAKLAEKNMQDAALANVTVVAADMLTATGTYDVINLDMQITPEHIRHAATLLKPGGYLACYTPFLEHLFLVLDTAKDLFSEVVTHELIEREMTRTDRGTRPSTRVCHTGYITIARR